MKNSIIVGLYVPSNSSIKNISKTLQSLVSEREMTIYLLIDKEMEEKTKTAFVNNKQIDILIIEKNTRPKAYNHLIEYDADFYCFIESGVILSDNCINDLILTLQSNPNHGIISVTTNNYWNKQSLYQDSNKENVDIKLRSAEQSLLYHNEIETLKPLLSVTEFFFITSRLAIDKTGFIDEKYGKGYCWEMDYCVRINRAGFECVWHKGHYAHNPNTTYDTERNQSHERNNKYYQSKFCKNKILKRSIDYCDHCIGDQCLDFAPHDLTQIHQSKSDHINSSSPLVSCIMPTAGRPKYVEQAINYFKAQDYVNCELIIIYDEETDVPHYQDKENNIHFHNLQAKFSIGYKRNKACEYAKGEIIIQWDDDDFHAKDRVSKQITPIISGECEITALYNTLFFIPEKNEFWECTPELFNTMFVKNVHGGSLAYLKSYWGTHSFYPDTSLREDADFLESMVQHGARLERIDGRNLYIYLRHDYNSWAFNAGSFINPKNWFLTDPPTCIIPYLNFYNSSDTHHEQKSNLPMVSCIMPTADRRDFLPRAIKSFLSQDYEYKELIIVDDGEDKIHDLIPQDEPSIKYIPLQEKCTIGTKRNLACKNADGEIIVHLDDDDQFSMHWISIQVNSLLKSEADITGIDMPIFYEPSSGNAWQYTYRNQHKKEWVHGATLCYTKSFWESNPFKDINEGEDAYFLWSDTEKKIIPHFEIMHYLGTIHSSNTSPKNTDDISWRSVKFDQIKCFSKVSFKSQWSRHGVEELY